MKLKASLALAALLLWFLMDSSTVVYIIDDDTITRFGVKKILSNHSNMVELKEFTNGKLALEQLEHLVAKGEELPDVLFLDINMPIMDGWQFLNAISELALKKKILINVLSSSIDPSDQRKFEFFKMNLPHHLTFLRKPILKISKENLVY